jgi:hypothetical protein
MDPVSFIVAALAAGAAAGLKDTAAAAVRDAYAEVRGWIQSRYGGVDVGALEQKPGSEAKRASLAEDFEDAGAGSDEELLELARKLVAVVDRHDPAAAARIGISLEDLKGASLTISRVEAAGDAEIRVAKSEFTGDVEISDVHAGQGGGRQGNPQ